MHKFFHSFRACTFKLPATKELSFIQSLITRQDAGFDAEQRVEGRRFRKSWRICRYWDTSR